MRTLVAIDLADQPERVLAEAAIWATRLGATLDVAFADPVPLSVLFTHDPTVAAIVAREQERLHTEHRARLTELTSTLPDAIRGVPHLLTGPTAEALLGLAASYDALILGTHGRTGVAHLWLGSVAEQIIRRASIPVLVLRLGVGG
ncbi:MAG TPA: universal stress protein [Myxococcota bacterium]|nr:universal stress protein [Myxococcota bacterium]